MAEPSWLSEHWPPIATAISTVAIVGTTMFRRGMKVMDGRFEDRDEAIKEVVESCKALNQTISEEKQVRMLENHKLRLHVTEHHPTYGTLEKILDRVEKTIDAKLDKVHSAIKRNGK